MFNNKSSLKICTWNYEEFFCDVCEKVTVNMNPHNLYKNLFKKRNEDNKKLDVIVFSVVLLLKKE